MGTNYYAFNATNCVCGAKHETQHLHIGKSSMGWYFSLHSIPELGLTTLAKWQLYLSAPCIVIEDEYGKVVSLADLLKDITGRSHPGTDNFDFVGNHAEPGINNLVRSRIGGISNCIAHGDGTWSMFEGEFC